VLLGALLISLKWQMVTVRRLPNQRMGQPKDRIAAADICT
jgi:hypothetical protein